MGDVAVKRNIPGYAFSAFMSAYWSTEARIDKFDKDLIWKQIAEFMFLPLSAACALM